MDSGTIEEIAALWVLRQHEESWTAADAQRLEAWLEESVLHRVTFIRLAAVWREIPRLKSLRANWGKGQSNQVHRSRYTNNCWRNPISARFWQMWDTTDLDP